jgi:hypothetical protein
MLPIQFAIEFETAITNQMHEIAVTADIVPLITLIQRCQTEFVALLSTANTINIDIAAFPPVNESQLLGADTAWQQFTVNKEAANAGMQTLLTLWSIYTVIDKTAQLYQQAATNSPHPQTRLFFNSLSHIKRILLRRLSGIIQSYNNYYWGELGFAPFMLGKD